MSHLASRVHAFALAVAIGLAFSFLAFGVTGAHEQVVMLGPLCNVGGSMADFDPMTGLPHGTVWTCDEGGGQLTVHHEPVPPDLEGRRAIPMPLGILIGTGAALAAFAGYADLRRRGLLGIDWPTAGPWTKSATWLALTVGFWAVPFMTATLGTPPDLSMAWEDQLVMAAWFIAAAGCLAIGLVQLVGAVAPRRWEEPAALEGLG